MAYYLTPDAAGAIYQELKVYAPRWLEDGGFTTPLAFELWSSLQPVHYIRLPEGLVLVTSWFNGLKAEVHPLIQNRSLYRDVPRLTDDLVRVFDELDVQKLVFRVRGKPGYGLRQLFGRVGARREGILRSEDYIYRDHKSTLIDVELWSILRKDLGLEVTNGPA